MDFFFDASKNFGRKEVLQFPVNCHACGAPGEENMCVTDIPNFKEVIIMSFQCEKCGYRNTDIKTGGDIPPKGLRYTLKVSGESPEDMKRGLLKSASARIFIPEIELEVMEGSMGGFFTTTEGLLGKISKQLLDSNPFAVGDSAVEDSGSSSDAPKAKMATIIQKLEEYRLGKLPFTLIIEDPLAGSFICPRDVMLSNETADAEDDPNVIKEEFERSWQDEESLGLHDMKTENYRGD